MDDPSNIAPKMDRKKIRIDRPSYAAYPSTPDTRGRARVYLKGKSYYFGAHGSPDSYAMYAVWLAEVMRSGEAYKPSDRRNDAIEFIGEGIVRKSVPKPWIAAGMIASAVVLSVAAVSYGWIISSETKPAVDDVAMTAEELAHVRSMRRTTASLVSHRSSSRVAEILERMSTEGLPDAPPPRRSAKPPIGPHD